MRWMLWTFAGPSQLLLLCVLGGALALALGWQRLGRWLCIAGAGGILLFGLTPLPRMLGDILQERFPQPALPERLTGILLLAGGERGYATERYGEPQLNAFGSRYVTALRLAVRYPEARLVFIGGPSQNPRTGQLDQTGVARRLLGSVGIDPRRISYDDTATDTCDSASIARARVRPEPTDRWAVVTSAVHMPRTVACFRAAGWDVIAQPADYQGAVQWWSPPAFRIVENLAVLDIVLHEWLGLAYYRWTGRTRELFPAP